MEQTTEDQTKQSKNLIKAILIAGLVVGIFDAIAASVSSYFPKGIMPDAVFRYVATGVYGEEALAGGGGIALMGLLFHFIIALGWTTLFFLAYPKLNILSRDKVLAGLMYGIFVLFAMNLLVVPLSNVPSPNPGTVQAKQAFIHMFLVGLPISLFANRYYSNK